MKARKKKDDDEGLPQGPLKYPTENPTDAALRKQEQRRARIAEQARLERLRKQHDYLLAHKQEMRPLPIISIRAASEVELFILRMIGEGLPPLRDIP